MKYGDVSLKQVGRVIQLVLLTVVLLASLPQRVIASDIGCDTSPDPWFSYRVDFDKSTLPSGVEFITKNEFVATNRGDVYGKFSLKNNGSTPLYLVEAFTNNPKPVYSYPNSELPPHEIPRSKLVNGKAYYYTTYPFEYRQNAGGIDNSAAYELNLNNEELGKMGVYLVNVTEDNRPASTTPPPVQDFFIRAYFGNQPIEIKGKDFYALNKDYDPKAGAKKKASCDKVLKTLKTREQAQAVFAFPFNTFSLFPYIAIVLLIIPVLVAIKRWNSTIEKEKAWTVLKRTRLFPILITVFWSSMLLYSHFRVYPALDDVYKAFNYPTPFILKIAPYSTFIVIPILIILALYIYFSKSISKEFEERLKHYKDGEKIKIRDLTGKKLNRLIILTFVIPAIALVLFTLVPGFQIISMVSNLPLEG